MSKSILEFVICFTSWPKKQREKIFPIQNNSSHNDDDDDNKEKNLMHPTFNDVHIIESDVFPAKKTI